jgi:glycosyltransferase involved in cell wall biosynthesis
MDPQSPLTSPAIALITNHPVGENMAGPGVRYWEFARVLGQRFRVKLIVPPFVPMDSIPPSEDLPASLHVCTRSQELRRLAEDCDIIVTLGGVLFFYPFLGELGKLLVSDMYNVSLLEDLQRQVGADMSRQLTSHENFLSALRTQLRVSDFFICASEKQRDFWLGTLSAMGRINPYTYQHDPTLRRLIDVVPFGLPEKTPQHTCAVLKGVYKSIAPDDKVVLWGGGIWNWFDAPALIKAMPLILQQRPDVKLFFMGTRPPFNNPIDMMATEQAIDLSKELGLYERYIFFNDWVPYNERQNYLLEADIGVSLHLDHAETRFSFRTRLLDYLWTALPIVSTAGDVMSDNLAAQGLAYLVAPGDVNGVAQTILALLDNPTLRADYAARAQQVAASYHWESVTQPLVKFCAAPYEAPDKAYRRQGPFSAERQSDAWWQLPAKGWRALRLGGLSGFLQQSREYLRWKIRMSK